ncbi:MAG: hypothetical protein HY720_28070 [Planctomycetes bacterium]|nr:hypothetical protein [Planctomycetota bacterium]
MTDAIIDPKPPRAWKPPEIPVRRVFLRSFATTLAVALLLSAFWSKFYWDYWFVRPEIDPCILEVERVNTVTYVWNRYVLNENWVIADDKEVSIRREIASARSCPYDNLDQRVLVALEGRGLLATLPPQLADDKIPELMELFKSTGVLVEEEPSMVYSPVEWLRGFAVTAAARSGEELLMLGLCGPQVSNDHYPYYEAFFGRRGQDAPWTCLSTQRFFYDSAGLEFLEGWSLWTAAALAAFAFATLWTIAEFWARLPLLRPQ